MTQHAFSDVLPGVCPRCHSDERAKRLRTWVYVGSQRTEQVRCDHPWHDYRPTVTDRPDLNALADRLDRWATWWDDGYDDPGTELDDDLRTAARILRAVAAAPGPLRELDPELSPRSVDEWREWLDALADAVGEG